MGKDKKKKKSKSKHFNSMELVENALKNKTTEIKKELKNEPEKNITKEFFKKLVISKKPMTKEEYDKQQSKIQRIYDPDTGRNRLVKGTGEIIEEIVSKEEHEKINKLSTIQDGHVFMNRLKQQQKY